MSVSPFPTTGASADATRGGSLPETNPPIGSHAGVVREYSDDMLDGVIRDLGGQNLRDLSNHETRWKADRVKAARHERRRRALNLA